MKYTDGCGIFRPVGPVGVGEGCHVLGRSVNSISTRWNIRPTTLLCPLLPDFQTSLGHWTIVAAPAGVSKEKIVEFHPT